MAGLDETLADMAALRRRRPGDPGMGGTARLSPVASFGANPGQLKMYDYAPDGLPPGRPLVVVLHGCTQTAQGYAAGAGWIDLAKRAGFAIVCPEQTTANNPNGCFNWFEPGDIGRGLGEAASIRSMVEAARVRHGSDRARIFVTGLSAGGAMANVMLAAYPEVFAGGGIIAGLPYGVAKDMNQAFAAMFQGKPIPGPALGAMVRQASSHPGPWPRIAVWQGAADKTVKPSNADAIVRQWLAVWQTQSELRQTNDGRGRQLWSKDGVAVIEHRLIAGLGHGTPLASQGPDGVGRTGPFLIEAGVSSSAELLAFWGVPVEASKREAATAAPAYETPPTAARASAAPRGAHQPQSSKEDGITGVIHRALRSAGLMK